MLNLGDLIGKPFSYGGRGPGEYDCYGLCMEVYRRLGRRLPEFGAAVQPHVIDAMIGEASQFFRKIDAPAPHCLVTFMVRPPYTSHIGVVLDDRIRFIHVSRTIRTCIERMDSPLWQRRVTGYYEWTS